MWHLRVSHAERIVTLIFFLPRLDRRQALRF
jgi:hypothetical protein